MFKSLSKYFVIFLVAIFSFTTMAKERPIDWDGNIYKIINNYTKVHRKFFKKVCQPKVEPMYMKLLREYRGQGYYLPKLGDNIDRQAIISNLHHFSKKIRFIDKQIERLKKTKKLIKFELLHNELKKLPIKRIFLGKLLRMEH